MPPVPRLRYPGFDVFVQEVFILLDRAIRGKAGLQVRSKPANSAWGRRACFRELALGSLSVRKS